MNLRENAYLLVHDDTDSIIKQTLSKNDGVQFGVDFVLIKNGKDSDWVRGGKRRPKDQAFKQREIQGFQTEERPDIHQDSALQVVSVAKLERYTRHAPNTNADTHSCKDDNTPRAGRLPPCGHHRFHH